MEAFELGWLTATLQDFPRTEISIIQSLSMLSLARTWITWRLGTGTRFRHLKQAASFAWHTVALQRRRHSVRGIAGSCRLSRSTELAHQPRVDQHKVGALKWCNIEREICHQGELGALLLELRSEKDVSKLLVRVRLKGLLYAADAGLLSTLREHVEQTSLFGRVDDKDLISAPGDDQWIHNLPDGIIRPAALRLREQRNAIATHALMELYQLVNGGSRCFESTPIIQRKRKIFFARWNNCNAAGSKR